MPRPNERELSDAALLDFTAVHVPGAEPVMDALAVIVERARSRVVQSDIMREVGFDDSDHSAFAVFDHLVYHGAAPPSRLAAVLGFAPSGMTKVVRRLLDVGLVAQAADPTDGRSSVIALTDKGRTFGARVLEYSRKHIAAELSGWDSHEAAEFARMLTAFAAGAHSFESTIQPRAESVVSP